MTTSHPQPTATTEIGDGTVGILIGASSDSEGAPTAGAGFLVTWSSQSPDTPLTTFRAKVTGEAENDAVGWMAAIGDQDGDGADEFVITSSSEGTTGAAYVVSGAVLGTVSLSEAMAKLQGEDFGDGVGCPVGLGDTNGDGRPDWAVTADGNDGSGENSGAVYILTSAPAGTVGLADADGTIFGEDIEDRLGANGIAGPGDLDGDGYADLMVGSLYHDDHAGVVYAFFGPFAASLDAWYADVRIDGGPSEWMGVDLGSAGDLNADGYPDIAVTVGIDDGTTEGASRVLVFNGPFNAELGSADAAAEVYAEFRNAGLGESVDSAGDVDGDGFGDLLIGAPDDGGDPPSIGSTLLLYGPVTGSRSMSEADWTATGISDLDLAGLSTRGAGDVNADGFDDFLVGASSVSTEVENGGAAYLILGGGG